MLGEKMLSIPDGWDELDNIVDETLDDLNEPSYEDVPWFYRVIKGKTEAKSHVPSAEAVIFDTLGREAFTVTLRGYTASQLRCIGHSNPIRERVIEMGYDPDRYRGSLFAIRDL